MVRSIYRDFLSSYKEIRAALSIAAFFDAALPSSGFWLVGKFEWTLYNSRSDISAGLYCSDVLGQGRVLQMLHVKEVKYATLLPVFCKKTFT